MMDTIQQLFNDLVDDPQPTAPTPFTGTLTLLHRYQSTTVTTGNHITCSRTTPSTNYTEEMFTHRDIFVVTLTVHEFAGGPVRIGILPAGPKLPTSRSNCGSANLRNSSAFVVAPDGTMKLIIKDHTISAGTWDAHAGAKLTVQWRAGRTTLSVNGTPLNVPPSNSPCMRGDYRLGVSLTTAGQRAQLEVDSFELGSARVTKGPVLRFVSQDRHIDLHDDNRNVTTGRDGNRLVATDATLAPGCTAFSVQVRVTSNKSPVWFGVVPARLLDSDMPTVNPWEDEGAVVARIENGAGALLRGGHTLDRCKYDGKDPVSIRLVVTDVTTVVVQVDDERLAPHCLSATKLTEPFRVVAIFTREGQTADIGDEDDVTAEIESTKFQNETFRDSFSFESPCTVMTNYADGRGFFYTGYGKGTNFSCEAFSSDDQFAVEMTPEDMCGGRIYLGFLSTDVEGQTVLNGLCGSKTFQPSAACVIEPRRIGIVYQEEWIVSMEFDASAHSTNVVRFEWNKGAVHFSVNGGALDCSGLRVFRGTFRLGVSVVKRGQRLTISTTTAHTDRPADPATKTDDAISAADIDSTWTTPARVSDEIRGSSFQNQDALKPVVVAPAHATRHHQSSTTPSMKWWCPTREVLRCAEDGSLYAVTSASAAVSVEFVALAATDQRCTHCAYPSPLSPSNLCSMWTCHGDSKNDSHDEATTCSEVFCDDCRCDLIGDPSRHSHSGCTHQDLLDGLQWSAGGLYYRIDLVIEETQGQPVVVGLVPAATKPQDVASCRDGFLVRLESVDHEVDEATHPSNTTPCELAGGVRGPVRVTLHVSADGNCALLVDGMLQATKQIAGVHKPHCLAVAFSAVGQRVSPGSVELTPRHGSLRAIAPREPLTAILAGRKCTALTRGAGQHGWVVEVTEAGWCTLLLDGGVKVEVPIAATTHVQNAGVSSATPQTAGTPWRPPNIALPPHITNVCYSIDAARAQGELLDRAITRTLHGATTADCDIERKCEEFNTSADAFEAVSFDEVPRPDWKRCQRKRREAVTLAESVIALPADVLAASPKIANILTLFEARRSEERDTFAAARSDERQDALQLLLVELVQSLEEAGVRQWQVLYAATRVRAHEFFQAHEPWTAHDSLANAITALKKEAANQQPDAGVDAHAAATAREANAIRGAFKNLAILATGCTPCECRELFQAVAEPNLDFLKRRFEEIPDAALSVNEQGETLLHAAISIHRERSFDLVLMLLCSGVDPYALDKVQTSAMELAMGVGAVDVFHMLQEPLIEEHPGENVVDGAQALGSQAGVGPEAQSEVQAAGEAETVAQFSHVTEAARTAETQDEEAPVPPDEPAPAQEAVAAPATDTSFAPQRSGSMVAQNSADALQTTSASSVHQGSIRRESQSGVNDGLNRPEGSVGPTTATTQRADSNALTEQDSGTVNRSSSTFDPPHTQQVA